MPAKRYRALVAFSTPENEAELKKCLAGKPYREIDVAAGQVLEAPAKALLESWLVNDVVEEVKDSGSSAARPA